MSTKSLALVCCLALALASSAQRSELFEFQSGLWMNLHHFLHALARPGVPLVKPLPPDATPDERARYFWPAHDADNKKFVAMLSPLLKQYGADISSRLAASYDETWPARPVRVDLVHDAGPPGNAYTTNDPTHITIGVRDARHQGVASLEIVFHEASHGWDQKLIDGVEQAAKRLSVPADQRLWHALLFFNAGKIVGDALAAGGVRDYAMYMEKEGMFDRVYRGWREPIAKHWTSFLAGKLSRDRAIELILKREDRTY